MAAAALFAVGLVAVAGSSMGPIFLSSADNSTLSSAIAQSPPGAAQVQILDTGSPVQLAQLHRAVADLGHLGRGRWFSQPTFTLSAGIHLKYVDSTFRSDLLNVTGICERLRFVAGRCPSAPGTVATTTRSGHAIGIGLGREVVLSGRRYRVVGVYAPPATIDTDYWDDVNYFDYGFSAGTGPGSAVDLDAFVTTPSTVLATYRYGLNPDFDAAATLPPGHLRAAQTGVFEQSLHAYVASAATRYGIKVLTPVLGVLAGALHSQSQMATVVEAIILQLVVLSLLVLYGLATTGSQLRAHEVALARQRGFTRRAVLTVAVAEPLVVLVVALPLGVLFAWGAVGLLGSGLFVRGTPVSLDVAAAVAGLAAFGGGVVATLAATMDAWRPQRRQSEALARRRAATASLDTLAVGLAAAGLLALTTSGALTAGRSNPLAALAPALLALGAGVVGLRLAKVAVRGLVRTTATRPWVATYLASREITRRQPDALRRLLVLTVALAVAVFAVAAWSLASTNRLAAATYEVGASRVVDVAVPPGLDLAAAVDAADPSGRYAMGAAVYQGSDGTLLAVQSSRLGAVASWPRLLTGTTGAAVGRYLDPPERAPIMVRGTALRASITTEPGSPVLFWTASLYNEATEKTSTVTLGTTRAGTAGTLVARLGDTCVAGCRLVNLQPVANAVGPKTPPAIQLTVNSLATLVAGRWEPLPLGAAAPNSWGGSPAGVAESGSGGGLDFVIPSGQLTSAGVTLSPNDLPPVIPAVITDEVASLNGPAPGTDVLSVPDLDGGIVQVAAKIQVSSLPGVGGNATLVDLGYAQLAQSDPSQAHDQVWLAAGAPGSIMQRLERMGVRPTGEQTAAARAGALDKSPLALAYTVVLWAAPVAVALAIGAAAFGMLATRRRRQLDLQSLAAVGIRHRILVRSVLAEAGLVLGAALVLGCGVGVVASHFALASLPQVTGAAQVPTSRFVPVLPVGLTVAILAVLLAATAIGTTAAITREETSDSEEGGG